MKNKINKVMTTAVVLIIFSTSYFSCVEKKATVKQYQPADTTICMERGHLIDSLSFDIYNDCCNCYSSSYCLPKYVDYKDSTTISYNDCYYHVFNCKRCYHWVWKKHKGQTTTVWKRK